MACKCNAVSARVVRKETHREWRNQILVPVISVIGKKKPHFNVDSSKNLLQLLTKVTDLLEMNRQSSQLRLHHHKAHTCGTAPASTSLRVALMLVR